MRSFTFGMFLSRLSLAFFLNQDKANRDKNKIENQQLRALPISGADISLHNRIGKR